MSRPKIKFKPGDVITPVKWAANSNGIKFPKGFDRVRFESFYIVKEEIIINNNERRVQLFFTKPTYKWDASVFRLHSRSKLGRLFYG